MKKLTGSVAIFSVILICSVSSQAQFLKSILNTVQQTAQNRANSKASQTTNKALDKVDSSTQIKSKSGNSSSSSPSSATPQNTESTNSVLGAFAKAAQQNPNDTSSADLTMKALGIMAAGGKEISAADSAAIIKSYMSGNGGSGEYYQYLMTSTTKKGTTRDTSYRYMTNSGSGRVEMKISFPGVMTNEMITIGHADNPQYTISLYPDSKTYSLNIIDTSLINGGGRDNYEVVKLGKETVAGYSCAHAKVTSTFGSGMFKSTSTMEIWTSTDVPGYALYKKMLATENIKPQMLQALEKAGCSGFLVKTASQNKDYSMTNVLIKAGEKSFPASMFEIPSGYAESKQNMMFHMASGAKKQ